MKTIIYYILCIFFSLTKPLVYCQEIRVPILVKMKELKMEKNNFPEFFLANEKDTTELIVEDNHLLIHSYNGLLTLFAKYYEYETGCLLLKFEDFKKIDHVELVMYNRKQKWKAKNLSWSSKRKLKHAFVIKFLFSGGGWTDCWSYYYLD